jgi:hypothetical protein
MPAKQSQFHKAQIPPKKTSAWYHTIAVSSHQQRKKMTEVVASTPVDLTPDEDPDMEALLAKFSAEHGLVDDDASEGVADDDDEDKFRHEVTVTDDALDHVVLGTSDLDAALKDFEAMTGVRPVAVTSMNGLGTKSARVSFNGCAYLEILGPDAKQAPTELSEKLEKIAAGEMVPIHYGIRSTTCKDRKADWKDQGLQVDMITMVSTDQGMPWKWDLYILEGHEYGGLIPSFLYWPELHACAKLPVVGNLEGVAIRAPADNVVHKLLAGIDGVDVEVSDDTCLGFTFTSEKGLHSYSSAEPIGVSFPQEGGLPVKKTGYE